jgi:hypothetical protein
LCIPVYAAPGHTGHRRFELIVLFFTRDPPLVAIELAPDLNSYNSVAERMVMDTLGNALSITPGIIGHRFWMKVEFPP